MILPNPQAPYRSHLRARLIDMATVIVVVTAVALVAGACFGGQTCRIDPNTGQVICARAIQPAAATPPADVARLPATAHCRITVGDRSMGSGTLVAKDQTRGTVLTAWHLFRDCRSGVVVHFTDGTSFPAGIIAVDQANDLAVLSIAAPAAAPIGVDESDPTGVVWVCGVGDTGMFVSQPGPVARKTGTMGWSDYNTVVYACVRQGDSGGAVINSAGCVAGVISAQDTATGETYAICGRPLANFLDRVWPNRPRRQQRQQVGQQPPADPWRAAPTVQQGTNEEWQAAKLEPTFVEAPPARTVPTYSPPPANSSPPPAVDSPSAAGSWAERGLAIAKTIGDSPLSKLAFYGLMVGSGGWASILAAGGVKRAAVWAGKRLLWRGAKRAAGKLAEAAGSHPAEAADTAATFPGSGQPDARIPDVGHDRMGLFSPVERDLTEGTQLLQLARLEGRDPLQDAIAGRLARSRLEEIADSSAPGNEHKKQFAVELLRDLDKRFNEIAPTNFQPAQGT